ncbi:hypothetical protein J3B01_001428 [Coemansia erecta]|nr:hypothetical protein J3F80_005130 [Coemansia sp. RSA 2526]KAJ2838420.1 hypothetical protein J3B01_001428 [Coemansia erecta]
MKRPCSQKNWVNLFTAPLCFEVEPTCSVCDCDMESWDAYYDHITFDPDHHTNELRKERPSRPKYIPAILYRSYSSSQKDDSSSPES